MSETNVMNSNIDCKWHFFFFFASKAPGAAVILPNVPVVLKQSHLVLTELSGNKSHGKRLHSGFTKKKKKSDHNFTVIVVDLVILVYT